MGDSTFINGRAAVHQGSNGKATGFPDVCFCPPAPPAGPVPTPLPNNVKAADLDGGATSVLIEGKPAGHARSFFRTSTGNQAAQSTGGGVVSAVVQGKAYFASFSPDVMIEGQPAVRHADLLTMNHASPSLMNTPPAPWMSTQQLPPVPPTNTSQRVGEGKDWLEAALVDEEGAPQGWLRYQLKTPDGQIVEGKMLSGAKSRWIGLPKGRCELRLPDVDQAPKDPAASPPAFGGVDETYTPGQALKLATGKAHKIGVFYGGTYRMAIHRSSRADGGSGESGAVSPDDRFILRSADGSYQVTRTPASDLVRGDRYLTLDFPGVRKSVKYALMHDLGSDGGAYTVFDGLTGKALLAPNEVEFEAYEEDDEDDANNGHDTDNNHETEP